MKLLIAFHSLYSLAGGVDNRLSELETSLPTDMPREYLLFKKEVDLPHHGKINFIAPLSIPIFVIKNKEKFKFLAFFYGFLNLFFRAYKTRKFIQQNNFTTILAVDDYFSLIIILSCIGLKKKIVCSVRNDWDSLYKQNMIHLLPDFVYIKILPKLMNKYVSHVHCVSKELKEKLSSKYKINNTLCIYNIFNIKNIQKKAQEESELKERYIINIGHFNKQKNQMDLITAYSYIKKEHKINNKLLLIGDGIYFNQCKELVKQLNIERDVIFLGKQTNPYKYLKNAILYTSSSLYEGLPAVFVESLILNIPIVSYDFETGAKELTKNLSKKDPKSLAKKIQYILTDENLVNKSIEDGKEILEKEFDRKIIINKWIGILR